MIEADSVLIKADSSMIKIDSPMIIVDRREVYRYLGYRAALPDSQVTQTVESCLAELQKAVTPRFTYRVYPLERNIGTHRVYPIEKDTEPYRAYPIEKDTGTHRACPVGEISEEDSPGENREEDSQPPLLRIAGVEIRSRNLSRNLRGCDSVCLMAATLGTGPDRLIARAGVTQMSRAVVLQAAAAAMIEAWSDEVNRQIMAEAGKQGLYCRPRFSPGYGDFSLEFQRDFAQILRLQKEIGVTLTQSLLMMPSKSVTAVIGLSKEKEDCALHGCEACAKAEDCAYSRI